MARRRLLAATTAVASALVLGNAVPALAGTTVGGTDGWDISLDVPDFTWGSTASGCEYVPVSYTTEGWGATQLSLDMDARHVESSSTSGSLIEFEWTSAPESVDDYIYSSTVFLCPSIAGPGTYVLEGTAEYGSDYDYTHGGQPGERTAWLATTFTVSKMSSEAQLDAIVSDGSQAQISGRVMAASPTYGRVAISSSSPVSIQHYEDGGWRHITTLYTDSLGYFKGGFTGVSSEAPFRAVYGGDAKVSGSTSPSVSPQLPPPPAPQPPAPQPPVPQPPTAPKAAVKVKATSSASKLRVDVNPNKGKGYWTFQVQRQNADGSWKSLKSYKTQGSKETRTINLPKGTYRVVVRAKYGFAETPSSPVYLKR